MHRCPASRQRFYGLGCHWLGDVIEVVDNRLPAEKCYDNQCYGTTFSFVPSDNHLTMIPVRFKVCCEVGSAIKRCKGCAALGCCNSRTTCKAAAEKAVVDKAAADKKAAGRQSCCRQKSSR